MDYFSKAFAVFGLMSASFIAAIAVIVYVNEEEDDDHRIQVKVQIELPPCECSTSQSKKEVVKKKKPIEKNKQDGMIQNRVENLEAALMEKDVQIRKLEKKVASMKQPDPIQKPLPMLPNSAYPDILDVNKSGWLFSFYICYLV